MSDTNLPPKKSSLPAPVEKAFAFVKQTSKPVKMVVAITLAVAVCFAIWFGVRASNKPYAVLFTELSAEDASAVVTKLKELKVEHRVVDGGRIEVPEERVHELRLEIAGAGLPKGGGVGFESFDKMRLGATEFEQKVLYRRALEGELVRTISSVAAIENARVHLVMPERSVFATRREPGSASVVVKLRPGRELGGQEIASIVHLVSSAVPNLSSDHVTLATTEGALLRRPKSGGDDGDKSGLGDDQLAEVRTMEAGLEDRARTMLERVVGAGHVDVKVSADMDFSRVETTQDRFQPQKPILRSEELSVEKVGTVDSDTLAGVPGAESNLPSGSAPEEESAEAPANAPGVVRHQHTRNFEVDRITEKRISKAGVLKRLTVAVVVDGVPLVDENGATTMVPRDEEEIARLGALVKSAVGATDTRNDVVTVDSIPFIGNVTELGGSGEAPVNAPVAPPTQIEQVKRFAPYGVAALLGVTLLGAFAISRRRRNKKQKALEAVELLPAAAKVAELEGVEELLLLNPRDEAMRVAAEDPATAALVVRHWLGMGAAEETVAA
jgi:flagellar M-ring protein FliF